MRVGFNGAMTVFDGTSWDGSAYQARFDELANKGVDVHGEAALVRSLSPRSVLDVGCGTGRVAIELSRYGIQVVGVDLDPSMIAEARRRAPELEWIVGDAATLTLTQRFGVVVLAGNVPLFCAPELRSALVSNSAAHLAENGALLAGFQLSTTYALSDYDEACARAGLTLLDRWSTWEGEPFSTDSDYAVSLHR